MEEKQHKDVTADDEPDKINYAGIKAMPFVIGNETFEKLGTVGTLANLLVYLTTVFRMKSITATNFVNIFTGTTNFATIIGAFLCDTYFGRYKTLGFASVASVVGMVIMTLTAAIPNLHPPACSSHDSGSCQGPSAWQMAFLLSGFGFLVIGAGGIRPCNLAFGADQFNPNTDSGKRGITSFFNWYYFTFTFAMMVSLTAIVYVQSDVSWAWGLGIPGSLMFLSCVFFFVGTRIYVIVKPEGSPLTMVVKVIGAAIKKRKMKSPDQPSLALFNHVPEKSVNSKLSHTDQFRCLDKAAIFNPDEDQINQDGSPANTWRLCTLQQVEEVKCLIRVLPIWLAAVIFYLVITQQQTYVVFQALQSDRRLGNTNFKIPAGSFTIFTMISLTIWIPIYDQIIVPWLRKKTGKQDGITILQKMGIGMFLGVVTMLVSAIVETKRKNMALANPIGFDSETGTISSLSGMWLIPQLSLAGLSEAFAMVAQVEFYYKQFPENMRSIGGSFTFVGVAISSYISSFLISIVHRISKSGDETKDWLPQDLNKGKLDYFYYLIAGIEALNLVYFILCARWYKYKGSDNEDLEVNLEKKESEMVLV